VHLRRRCDRLGKVLSIYQAIKTSTRPPPKAEKLTQGLPSRVFVPQKGRPLNDEQKNISAGFRKRIKTDRAVECKASSRWRRALRHSVKIFRSQMLLGKRKDAISAPQQREERLGEKKKGRFMRRNMTEDQSVLPRGKVRGTEKFFFCFDLNTGGWRGRGRGIRL